MGGDGGVIATQRAFARGVGKNEDRSREAKNVHLDQTSRASNCALTNEVSLVSCYSILEFFY